MLFSDWGIRIGLWLSLLFHNPLCPSSPLFQHEDRIIVVYDYKNLITFHTQAPWIKARGSQNHFLDKVEVVVLINVREVTLLLASLGALWDVPSVGKPLVFIFWAIPTKATSWLWIYLQETCLASVDMVKVAVSKKAPSFSFSFRTDMCYNWELVSLIGDFRISDEMSRMQDWSRSFSAKP